MKQELSRWFTGGSVFSVFTQFDVTFLKVLQIIRESLYVHRRDRL